MNVLEKYGHGGDWTTAEERFGRPTDGWLDFSANMNPAGPPESVGAICRDHWREIARYPDPAVRALRLKLARAYGVPPDSILVGNGAAELIDLAVRGAKPREALLAQPSFKEYEDALRKAGVRIRGVPLRKELDYTLTPDDLEPQPGGGIGAESAAVPNSAMGSESASNSVKAPDSESEHASASSSAAFSTSPSALPDCVLIGHPNNPTGRLVPRETLDRLRRSGSLLLVDEAFMDFVPEEESVSLLREAAESERLVVFRSMTKFYAIAGIRLGFMVAHPKRIEELRELQPPWSVNFFAQRIGEAVLDEREYADRTHRWLAEERPYLTERLRELGIGVCPSDVNYLLGELPEASGWTTRSLQERLAASGILIRDASLFPGLGPRCFRVAVRLRHENDRLLAELGRALAKEAPPHG